MLIVISEFFGVSMRQHNLINDIFKGEQKTFLKVKNDFKYNQFSTAEELTEFYIQAAENCVVEVCDLLEAAEFENLKVVILVEDITILHHIVFRLQEANIKCFVHSRTRDWIIELANYLH